MRLHWSAGHHVRIGGTVTGRGTGNALIVWPLRLAVWALVGLTVVVVLLGHLIAAGCRALLR